MIKYVILLVPILLFGDGNFYLFTINNDYKEYDSNGHFLDGDKSKFFDNLGIGFDIYKRNSDFTLEYSRGKSTYDGETWGGTKLQLVKKNVSIFNICYDFIVDKTFKIGLGYRSWHRGKSDYIGDYEEIYYWRYLNIGYIFKNNKFNISATLQNAIDPQMKAYLGEGYQFNLGDTYGGRFKLFYNINKKISLFYKFQYWKISRSNKIVYSPGVYLYEPDSLTISHFVGIGYKF